MIGGSMQYGKMYDVPVLFAFQIQRGRNGTAVQEQGDRQTIGQGQTPVAPPSQVVVVGCRRER